MSGGSYGYLFSKDLTDEVPTLAIQRMADHLREAGFPDAADATFAALLPVAEINDIQKDLADIWKAVEWTASSDWSADSIEEAVTEWRARTPPADRRMVALFTDDTSYVFDRPEETEADYIGWADGSPMAILSDGTAVHLDRLKAVFTWQAFTEYRSRQQ